MQPTPLSVISSRWLHRPPGDHNPNYASYEANHAEMREESVPITQKALFKRALCPIGVKQEWGKMKGEWHAQCQMCAFPGHGCQILFKPHTCHRGDTRRRGTGRRSAERIRTEGRQIQTSWGHVRLFLCVVHVPPLRSEWDANLDDVTTQRYPGTEFHRGTSNATPRWDKGCPRADDRKQQWPAGAFFSRGYLFSEVKHQSLHYMQNNKTVQVFWKHKNLNKGHLKSTVKFARSSDPPPESEQKSSQMKTYHQNTTKHTCATVKI